MNNFIVYNYIENLESLGYPQKHIQIIDDYIHILERSLIKQNGLDKFKMMQESFSKVMKERYNAI